MVDSKTRRSTTGKAKPGDETEPGTAQQAEQICPECGGSGEVEDKPCPDCDGTGKIMAIVGDA